MGAWNVFIESITDTSVDTSVLLHDINSFLAEDIEIPEREIPFKQSDVTGTGSPDRG
jgi:hypothetical protein